MNKITITLLSSEVNQMAIDDMMRKFKVEYGMEGTVEIQHNVTIIQY